MQQCGLCNSQKLEQVIDVGETPIAHEFSATAKEALVRKTYPMRLLVCQSCGMGQLAEVIEPSILYSEYNFCFSAWKKQPHIEDECRKLTQYISSGTIVEVGCNDGLFLASIAKHGDFQCIGIEPNKVSSATAREQGFEVINKFFDEAVINDLADRKVDALFARQVMEHIPNVEKFLASVNQLLNVGGYIGIEVPNTEIALKTGDISCLWEEHVNYFTPSNLKIALEGMGFKVVEHCTYQFSGEATFMLAVKERDVQTFTLSTPQDISLYQGYSQLVTQYNQALKATIEMYKAKGYQVALYGSGCRSSMILHGLSLNEHVDLIIDDQQEKQGLFMSANDIAIQGLASLAQHKKYVFILSVNHENDDIVSTNIRARNFDDAKIFTAHSPANIIDEIKQLS